MTTINKENFKKAINESIVDILDEAGLPFKTLGGGSKPQNGPAKSNALPFKVLGGGNAPVQQPSAPAATPASAQPSANDTTTAPNTSSTNSNIDGGVDANGKHRPGIMCAKYEPFYETRDPNEADKEVLKIWLSYINTQAVQRFITFLNQNYGDIVFSPMPNADMTCRMPKNLKKSDGTPYEAGFNQYWVKIIVRPEKNAEFIKKVPEIVDGLYQIFDTVFSSKKRGRPFGGNFQGNAGQISYDQTYKPKFAQYIIDMVNKTPTPEEMQEVNIKIAQTVRELLMHLKDPQVQAKLGMVRVIMSAPTSKAQLQGFLQNKDMTGDDGKLAGWLLSKRNALKVLAQDPNATYVAQDFTWRQWGHEVIDPSKYIVVNMPTTWKNHDDTAFDKACKAAGFAGGINDYKYAKKNKLYVESPQKYYALMHLSNLYNPNGTEFGYKKFYDIANTRVIPGMVSKFLPGPDQQQGLSNNLTGEVNAAARAAGFAPTTPQPQADTSAPSVSANPEEVELFRDALAAIVAHVTQSAPSGLGTSAERDIVKWAYFYADYLVKTQYASMIKETAELFKQGFAAAIAASIGISDKEAADYLERALGSRGKDSKIDQLVAKWHGEYVDLLMDVQKEANAMSKKRSKGSVKNKVAVEESIINENGGFRVLNLNDFRKFFGDSGEQNYEVQDDAMSLQNIQESFFTLLDKLEGYDR